jgi:hypothetical protein
VSAGSSSARVVVADADACSASRRTWFAKGKAESENGLSVVFLFGGLINGTSLDHFFLYSQDGSGSDYEHRPSLSIRAALASRSTGGPSSLSVGKNCKCLCG